MHSDEKNRCDECGKTFATKSTLNLHRNSIHLKSQQFTCDFESCGKTFSQKGNLKKHIQSVHEQIRFSCDFCELTLTTRASLRQHIQSIHEEIRYNCDQCTKTFSHKSTLNHHKKKQHYNNFNLNFIQQEPLPFHNCGVQKNSLHMMIVQNMLI